MPKQDAGLQPQRYLKARGFASEEVKPRALRCICSEGELGLVTAAAGGTVIGVGSAVGGTVNAGSCDVLIGDVLGLEQVADFREQFLGSWCRSLRVYALAALRSLGELVERHDDEEVDHRGDDEEVDRCGDYRAEVNKGVFVVGDLKAQPVHLSGAKGIDDRLDDRVSNGGDDCGEGGADDDRGGKFDDVAAHDEVFETLEHGEMHEPFWE